MNSSEVSAFPFRTREEIQPGLKRRALSQGNQISKSSQHTQLVVLNCDREGIGLSYGFQGPGALSKPGDMWINDGPSKSRIRTLKLEGPKSKTCPSVN